MENKQLKLPQLVLISRGGNRIKFLERLPSEVGKPKVNLTFQEDSKDPRIIAIKYQTIGEEAKGDILYYSEEFNKHAIVTFNIGYRYEGRVIAKVGINLEHLSKEGGLRKKHIERINRMDDIKSELTPEYVARRYQDFFYSLQKFL